MTGRPAVIIEKQQNNGIASSAPNAAASTGDGGDVATASFSNAAAAVTQVGSETPLEKGLHELSFEPF